jgi:DNA-binding NarL/FixJ family response regulator
MIGHERSPFVGRDEAITRLRRGYAAAESGSAQVVLVTGEAGIGKTRLVSEFVGGVEETALLLATHCLELAGAEMPLAPVHGLVHRAYRRLGGDALREAAGPYTSEVTALEPALGTADGAVDQLRVFAAVRHVLESLSTRSPVVVVVEDLHWADQPTLSLLRFLAATIDDAPVLIVGTERTGGHRSAELTEVQRLPRVSTLALDPLSAPDAEALATALAEDRPGLTVDAVSIAERSAGNPLYVEELVAAGSALPSSLRGLLHAHLDGLSRPARDLVELISVGDPPVRYDDLAAASRRPADEVDEAIAEAQRHNLLTVFDTDRLRLRHALLGEAIRFDLDPGRLRSLHQAWADSIEQTTTPLHPHAALALARHRAAAGEPDSALQAALDGAKAAEALDLHDVRAMLLTRVLELQASGQVDALAIDEAEIMGQAAKSADLAGLPGATDLLDDAISRVDPSNVDLLVELLVARAAAEGRSDHPEMPALERALHVLPATGHDRARGRVLAEWADNLVTDFRADEARPKAEEALRLARGAGDLATEALALKCMASAVALDDPERSLELSDKAIDVADRAKAYGVMVTAMMNSSNVRAERLGRYEESMRALEGYIRLARQRHIEHRAASLHIWSAAGAWHLGRLDEVEDHLRAAERWLSDHVNAFSDVYIRQIRAVSDLVQGDLSRARAFVAEAPSMHYFQYTTPITWVRSWLTWIDVGPDEATAVLLPDVENRTAPGKEHYLLGEPEILFSLAQYVQRGSAPRDASHPAARVLAHARDAAKDKVPHSPLAAVLHATLAGFDGADATQRWRAAAQRFAEAEGPVYWRIDTLIQLAETTSDRGEARDALDSAERDALVMNARPQLDSIAAARQRLSDRPAPAGLSRREVEILRLVGQRLTNSQIAERLFISPSTVGVHISHILTKTGTSSRGEAASWGRDANLLHP